MSAPRKSKRSPMIAKVAKGWGTPAVWLTHSLWLTIKRGVVKSYLDQREEIGRCRARKLVKKPDALDSWGPGETYVREALEFYKVGFDTHCRKYLGTPDADLAGVTPDRMIEIGDQYEAKAMAHELARLNGHGPDIFLERRAA